jgi:wyosine [tRNA(Phe)-imidazoG37] synthetase (radical SAM superfamily)
MADFIFGPVQSRRFGLSLGIDLSPKIKQCNFDCLYCELKGAKSVETAQNPPSVADIINELIPSLSKFPNIDVITITANGEPTLYPYLKELADEINKIKKNKKLLILSNGSLIYDENVRNALLEIDIVKLSIDTVEAATFKKLDRPHKSISLERVIEGMKEFRKVFKNELVLETLVVENINDTRDEFIALNSVINEIKPDRIDIGTIDRPSAYKVNPVSFETLEILSREIRNIPLVIAKRGHFAKPLSLGYEEILSLLARRPQSVEDVALLFDEESRGRVLELLKAGKIGLISAANIGFYKLC